MLKSMTGPWSSVICRIPVESPKGRKRSPVLLTWIRLDFWQLSLQVLLNVVVITVMALIAVSWIADALMYQEEGKDSILRQTIWQNQILRKFIPWKNRTVKLLWMALKTKLSASMNIYKQKPKLTRQSRLTQSPRPWQESRDHSRLWLSWQRIRRGLMR